MMPRVSIIIPTYNMSRFVRGAVESALAEGYGDAEIIVVDDGSVDDTEAVLRSYTDGVTYHRQDNEGLPGALNTLTGLARGEYLRFLDADDALLPGTIDLQVRALDAHPGVALIHGEALLADEFGAVVGRRRPGVKGNGLTVMDSDRALRWLVRGCKICKSTVMVRRSAVVQAGGFSANALPGEDWDMWMRLSTRHSFAYLPDALCVYRVHADSITAGYTVDSYNRSHRYALDSLFSSEPDLPRSLERSAYAYLERNLALLSGQLRSPGSFVRHFAHALLSHPAMMIEKDTWSTVAEGMKMFLPGPVFHATRGLKRSIGGRVAQPTPAPAASMPIGSPPLDGSPSEPMEARRDT